jgi:hypothetical protein
LMANAHWRASIAGEAFPVPKILFLVLSLSLSMTATAFADNCFKLVYYTGYTGGCDDFPMTENSLGTKCEYRPDTLWKKTAACQKKKLKLNKVNGCTGICTKAREGFDGCWPGDTVYTLSLSNRFYCNPKFSVNFLDNEVRSNEKPKQIAVPDSATAVSIALEAIRVTRPERLQGKLSFTASLNSHGHWHILIDDVDQNGRPHFTLPLEVLISRISGRILYLTK